MDETIMNNTDPENAKSTESIENIESIESAEDDHTKKKSQRKILGILFDVFTVVVIFFVIFLLFCMFQMKGLSANGIALGGFRAFLIQTMSMEPEYPVGSVVVAKSVPVETLKEGDVISFRVGQGGLVLTHRIVDIERFEDGYYMITTKGDTNLENDRDKVDGRDVFGIIIMCIPKLGLMLNWLRSIWGLLLLVILPAGLVIVGESVRLTKVIKEEKEKKRAEEALNSDADSEPEGEVLEIEESVSAQEGAANAAIDVEKTYDENVNAERTGGLNSEEVFSWEDLISIDSEEDKV